ncbi:MAG: Hdr-like menaquinol oxidoreductase cytochrome c subunit [Rhodospirillales bacterium]|nr:Hdr-like menaquinol oxidoreductase cytochrome c subunit [Rhodospirillales bacterium]
MRILAALLIALSLGGLALPVLAGPPDVPKGAGEKCLAAAATMRRNHMSMLMHRRDATMHQGVRASTNGLKACLDCHAVNDGAGQPVGIDSDKHFCRVCHDYAAVKVDCFECHASKPAAKKAAEAPAEAEPMVPPEAAQESGAATPPKPEGPK